MCRKILFPVALLHTTLWNRYRYLLSVHLMDANNANYEFLSLVCHIPPSQMLQKLSFHAFLNSKNSTNRLFSAAVLVLSLKPVDLFSCFSLKDLEVPWNTCHPSKMQMLPQETCYVIFIGMPRENAETAFIKHTFRACDYWNLWGHQSQWKEVFPYCDT